MSVPPHDYVTEVVRGVLWADEDTTGLTLPPLTPPPDVDILAEGEIILRYGIEILQSPNALVVGLFIAESGAFKTGRDAWEWIWKKFQLYPRAEVLGIRSDGKEAHLYMRDLDFGAPVRVLAYADRETNLPLGTVFHLEAPEGADMPELMRRYLLEGGV